MRALLRGRYFHKLVHAGFVLARRHHHKFATLVKMSMGKARSSPVPRSAAMGPDTVGGTYAISCCSRALPVACALWLPLDYAR